MEMKLRICFFGDSFTHGVGDDAGLGWRGRVAARLVKGRPNLTAYDLGIRRDTSTDILHRWETEARARLPQGCQHRLAFCFGSNDCADDGTGTARVSLEETIANTKLILGKASAMAPTILIGPPPILDDSTADQRIAELEPALQSVAWTYNVPFLPVFEKLRQTFEWTKSAAVGDGTHPNTAGYAFLADYIWAWPEFSHWIEGSD